MLVDLINIEAPLDENLVKKWNSIVSVLRDKYVTSEPDVNGSDSYKYRFDFTGLLLSYNIPLEFHYPTMLVNNVPSSTLYDGKPFKLKIVSLEKMTHYLELFNA